MMRETIVTRGMTRTEKLVGRKIEDEMERGLQTGKGTGITILHDGGKTIEPSCEVRVRKPLGCIPIYLVMSGVNSVFILALSMYGKAR